MAKVLEQINSDYKGRIETEHIYLEDNPDVAEEYNVRYVPMLIFRDGTGSEVSRVVGYRSVDDVIKIFREAGVKI